MKMLKGSPARDWLGAGLFLLLLPGGTAAYDWLQLNGDPQHSGNNTSERLLGSSNIGRLAFTFQVTLPAVADGAPAYLRGVPTASGTRDVLFLTTKAGHILALDAHTGALIWSHQYPAASCRINNGSTPCYTTSSPAIDPNRLYIYGYGLDGKVHKYQVGDGAEVMDSSWPATATLKGFDEKGSSALSIATAASSATYLYVTNGGYPGDAGDYQGHVTAINLADGTQAVFNTICSDQTVHFVEQPGTPDCDRKQAAIWARVGVVYDDVTDRIYMGTGNGLFDASSGGHEWGDSVFSLHPDGTGSSGKPLDSYTPSNFQQLADTDADLGSTAPAVLPATSFPGRLAVQGGKDANLRLINLANLSGQSGPGHVGGELQILPVPQGGGVLTAPAVWINPSDTSTWVFVSNGAGSSGLKLTFPNGVPMLVPQWQNTRGGFSPLVANGVLYNAASGIVRAFDPLTGGVLWSDSRVGGIHWESPIVANGMLYVTDESSHLTAYLLGQSDFNGDGRTDIVWRDLSGGLNAFWQMDGTSPASVVSLPSVFDSTWRIVGVADFNGDGMPDLLWHNAGTGANGIWLMNGASPASVVGLPTVTDTSWKIVGTGDFNSDGQPDIVWRSDASGLEGIWLMNGSSVSSVASLTPVYDTTWKIVSVGDFNSDGMADLIWRNASSGIAGIWLMNGTAVSSIVSLPTVSDTSWQIAGPR